jgi:hypothetical protein
MLLQQHALSSLLRYQHHRRALIRFEANGKLGVLLASYCVLKFRVAAADR